MELWLFLEGLLSTQDAKIFGNSLLIDMVRKYMYEVKVCRVDSHYLGFTYFKPCLFALVGYYCTVISSLRGRRTKGREGGS